MRTLKWNDGTKWGDPNAKWGSPSYVLEPGDPGYTPPAGPPEESYVATKDNMISEEVAAEVKTQVLQKIQEIWALLPFLVNVAASDKANLPSIGDKREGMDQTFIKHMTEHPDLVPSFVNMPEVLKDLKFRGDMGDMIRPLAQLLEAMTDTRFLANHDNFMAYLATYNNTQSAAQRDYPGADTILPDMARYFAKKFAKASPTPTPAS